MNRIKGLPWSQILLALLVVTGVVGVIELARIAKAVEDLYSAIGDLQFK